MKDDLDDFETLEKFRVFVKLFHSDGKQGVPAIRWNGSYTTNKNITFSQIEDFVKDKIPSDLAFLVNLLHNDPFLSDENFVPEQGSVHWNPKTSKLFKLDGSGMSYICILRRF